MKSKNIIGFLLGIILIVGVSGGTTYFFLHHVQKTHRALSPGASSIYGWSKEVKLTQEQKEKLTPLETALKKDLDGFQTQLAENRMAICELLAKEAPDTPGLNAYVQKVSALEGAQQRRVVEHLLRVRDILTSEQKTKFFAAIMQDICVSCRKASHLNDCVCGLCGVKKG